MSAFDGLTASSFKRDESGRLIFYPWGTLGKGRVAPDNASGEKLRTTVRSYYLTAMPAIVAAQMFVGWKLAMAIFIFSMIYFCAVLLPRVRDWPVSTSNLTYAESSAQMAVGLGPLWLTAFLGFAIFMALASVYLLCLREHIGTGIVGAIFFSAISMSFYKILRAARSSSIH
jgi:hypothetical protein